MITNTENYSFNKTPQVSVEDKEKVLIYLKGEFPKESKKSITLLAEHSFYENNDFLRRFVKYIQIRDVSISEFLVKCHGNDIISCLLANYQINCLEDKSTDGMEIMYFSAYLHKDNIPDKLLVSWFQDRFNLTEESAQQKYYSAIQVLEDRYLIKRSEDKFSIFSFAFQDEIRLRCKLEIRNEAKLLKKVAKHICNILNTEMKKNSKDLVYLSDLVSHMKVLSKYLEKGYKKSLSMVCSSIGHYYCDLLKDYQEALQYYTKAELLIQNIYKSSNAEKKEYVNVLNKIGFVLYELFRVPESLTYYSKAIEIRRKLFDKYPKSYAKLLSNLAYELSTINENQRALKYYKEALKITDSPADNILYLNHISEIYKKLGKIKEARKYHLKAEAIEEEKCFNILRNIRTIYNC